MPRKPLAVLAALAAGLLLPVLPAQAAPASSCAGPRGRVFVSTFFGGGNAYELGDQATRLATGLGDEWHTNPQLHFEPGSWKAWALSGRHLARLDLDPRCPSLTVTPPQL
ncbi:hypothetical protein [Nonomuraea rubra]|uniref:hypothetical protein n=1 Tax=Nonomuraea rubra TaxID=46180 RepID=UPI0033E854F7